MRSKKGITGLAVIFIFIFLFALIAVALFAFYFLPKNKNIIQTTPDNEIIYYGTVLFKIKDTSNNMLNANYKIKRSDGVIIQSGITNKDNFEQVLNLSSNYTYQLMARRDGKYAEIMSFNYNESQIFLSLRDLPNIEIRSSKESEDKYFIQILTDNLIRSTILCEAHGKNIKRVKLFDKDEKEISEFPIPERLSTKVDRCFGLGNVETQFDAYLTFTSFPLESGDDINLIVLDQDYPFDSGTFFPSVSDKGLDIGASDFWYDLILKS